MELVFALYNKPVLVVLVQFVNDVYFLHGQRPIKYVYCNFANTSDVFVGYSCEVSTMMNILKGRCVLKYFAESKGN